MLLLVRQPELSTSKFLLTPNSITTLNPRALKIRTPVFRVSLYAAKIKTVTAAAVVKLQEMETEVKKSEKEKEEEERREYYVNMGYAIRSLREEFPSLFYREPNFDIYRDDIVFKDPMNTFVGIEQYKSIFWALRFHGRMFFRALWIDIISVWQPVENVIMIRWTVHGAPRVPWESRARFDGVSEYKLDKSGKIFQHEVHNIALNSPPKFRVLAVHELIQSIGCPSAPRPTYIELSSSSATREKK